MAAGRPGRHGSPWADGEAGPLVRPYAMTDGRTRLAPRRVPLDLIALVSAIGAPGGADEPLMTPEHRTLLILCRDQSRSVAELAADAGLSLEMARVLLSELLELEYLRVSRPTPPEQPADVNIPS
jgi:hypothetical protein